MVRLYERNNIVFLEAVDYFLKIDNNRIIYVKPSSSSVFKSLGSEVPKGLSVDDKKKFLYNLFLGIEKRRKDSFLDD